MMQAHICGIGWVDAAGPADGRCGRAFCPPAGALPRVTRKQVFAAADQRFNRLDDFSRTGLAGAVFALRDAGLQPGEARREIALVAASDSGCVHADVEYFDTVVPAAGALASPNIFAYTLPNSFLGEIAIRFGLTGPAFVLNPAGGGDLGAVTTALGLLADGACEAAVAGACHLPWPEGMDQPAPGFAGALFFVLAPEPLGDRAVYGAVAEHEHGVTCNGTPCRELIDLLTHATLP